MATRARVAVKVITGDIGKHASLVQRFQREAKAAGAIDTAAHRPGARHGDGPGDRSALHGDGVPRWRGSPAAPPARRRSIPPELALRIVAQACLALDKAHAARVVHRDMKPANLFLAEREGGEIIVKILDFGIAKIKQDQAVSAETAGLTRTGSMLGSPLYMSPEQARGHKTIDHRADIWSLGIVLYQSLAGRTPYDDIDALGELIIAICSEPPRNVQELAPWVPPQVAAIVHKALRFDPNERYQSAAAMHAEIVALLPNGYGIQKSMLVPVTMETKAQQAPKYELSNVGMVRAATMPSHGTSSPSQPPGSVGGSTNGAATNQGVTRSDAGSAPRRTSTAAVLGAFAVVAVLGGFGVYKLASNDGSPPPPVVTQQAIVATTAPAPSTVPSVAPTQDKTVKVVLVPSDTSAEVDGASVTSRDGIIEVTGALGSVHKVRVFKGKNETLGEVVVTEAGAMPPKLELAAPAAGVTAKPKPGTPGPVATAAATAKPAAPPTATPKGIDTKFE